MSAIFGGSKSKQKSQSQQTSQSQTYNQAYPWAQQTYNPVVQQGNSALDLVSKLLSGGAAGDAALSQYKDSAGFRTTLDSGSQAITNNRAARGLLGSGSTLRRLTQFGQDTAQKYFTDYITKLLGLGSAGLQAGGLITGAGQVGTSASQGTSSSSGSSSSTGGLAALLGAGS